LFPFEVRPIERFFFGRSRALRNVEAGSKARGVPGEPLDKERSRICRKACDYIRRIPKRQAVIANLSPLPRLSELREPSLTSPSPQPPVLVLDTNVVLDWLLFADASSMSLAAAIASRRVRWVVTAAMRGEFAHVLDRGLAAARNCDPAAVLAAWDAHACACDEQPGPCQSMALRCADPDDQKFLDLACAARARWLLSRDRAVLRLARRAAALGIAICVPERWSAPE
jgi:predicted nucleic acid-binding protein